MLEYAAALERGDLDSLGWREIVTWAGKYLPQPDYAADAARVFFLAMRHPVAHHGIASGVWIDRHSGPGQGRRLTWKIYADTRRPAIQILEEPGGVLKKDPPWPCRYSHRIHIHLHALWIDIRSGLHRYIERLVNDAELLARFNRCMRQLYPG
jgi:hypothetical protein